MIRTKVMINPICLHVCWCFIFFFNKALSLELSREASLPISLEAGSIGGSYGVDSISNSCHNK